MLQGATIVILSSIDWAFNWQVPQEIASGLSASGNRVLFIENTGVRRPALRDASRLGARLRNWWAARGRVREVAPGLHVYAPLVLPFPYSRLARRLNEAALLRVVRQWQGRVTSPLIFLTFLPTPLARALAASLAPALVVYYCADRLAESSPAARRVAGDERQLLADADLVFTTSAGLLQLATELTTRAVLLTSGVRYFDFERARATGGGSPAGLASVRRPVVGFVGSVRNELDLALLGQAARLAPDLSFVLVGPTTPDVSPADFGVLSDAPNVTLVGPVPHDVAIRYMLAFDVGVLPYALNEYTAHVMPVKLKEYLAAGLPVVSTGLPEVRRFNAEHGAIVRIAADAPAFVTAIRDALADTGPAAVDRRLEVARAYDWGGRIATISGALADALVGRSRPAVPIRSAS